MVGRQRELSQLTRAVTARRGAVITGLAEVGKTTLALNGVEWAEQRGMSPRRASATRASQALPFGTDEVADLLAVVDRFFEPGPGGGQVESGGGRPGPGLEQFGFGSSNRPATWQAWPRRARPWSALTATSPPRWTASSWRPQGNIGTVRASSAAPGKRCGHLPHWRSPGPRCI
jgi:hypothetical protein